MRSFLDGLYAAARIAACLSMVSILMLVVAQLASRLFGFVAPGVDEYAGYTLVATIFLALGPALKAGAHIRVLLLVQALPPRLAWFCELGSLAVGLGLSAYFAYWSGYAVVESYQFNEVGQGMVKTPLWIPQLSMAVGLAILVIAFIDNFLIALFAPRHQVPKHSESHALEMGEV
jgi:TRAP-type C4-dicarboxylate transport system permease small subunit